MYNYFKFINVLQASGLTLKEAQHIIRFDGEGMDRYKEQFYSFDLDKAQIGGSSKSVKYNGQKYKFNKTEDIYGRLMFTLRQDIDTGLAECIHVSIDPEYNYAYIESISNLEGCLQKGVITNKGGNDLMKIAIMFIYRIKDKYKLKYIQLRDNAAKYINGERILLRYLIYLTKGRTWYEKFGFIPCDVDIEGRMNFTVYEFKKYSAQTKKYMTKLVKEMKLNKKDMYKTFIHYDKNLIKMLYKNIKRNESMLIKDYVLLISNKKKYVNLLNTLLNEFVMILKLRIPISLCVDINNAYDLVINENI